MVYAVSVVAQEKGRLRCGQNTFLIEADNDDEANGRAARWAAIAYPVENGWDRPSVAVSNVFVSGAERPPTYKITEGK